MIKAVLLDVDGVLIESEEALCRAYAHTFTKFGFAPPSREKVLEFVGRPGSDWIRSILPEEKKGNSALVHEMAEYNRQKYLQFYYPILVREAADATKTLKALKKKYKIAIITNGNREVWQRHESFFHWQGIPDAVVTASDVSSGKPSAEPLKKALLLLGASQEQAIMVGDTANDTTAAKAAGIKSVLVSNPQNLELDSDYRIKAFKDLPELLKRIGGK